MLLPNTAATQAFGARLALALQELDQGLTIALAGELGAGKTTLARATITALGHDGPVVSPTYTLLESYPVAGRNLHHLDLYRLNDPQELEFIGLRELAAQTDWFMIEWPERGAGHLPALDVTIELAYVHGARSVAAHAESSRGSAFACMLQLER